MNSFCDRSCSASYNNRIFIKNPKKENVDRDKSGRIIHKDRKLNYNISLHNKLLDTKYSDLNIPHINPGCCLICGQPNCTNPFCKENNFQKLIWLHYKLGLDATSIGTIRIFEEYKRVRDEVYDLYWNKKKSLSELAEIYEGIKDFNSIYYTMKKLGIPRRSFEESNSNAYLTGRNNITTDRVFGKTMKSEHHLTWEGNEVFLRSSYEVDYAIILDSQQIKYLVEDLRITYYDSVLQKNRVAVPDFYLPDTNEIVEIKSDFTLDIQEMLDKFDSYKKLGYIPKLILEHEEIDLYNIENLIPVDRLERIKTRNLKILSKLR